MCVVSLSISSNSELFAVVDRNIKFYRNYSNKNKRDKQYRNIINRNQSNDICDIPREPFVSLCMHSAKNASKNVLSSSGMKDLISELKELESVGLAK